MLACPSLPLQQAQECLRAGGRAILPFYFFRFFPKEKAKEVSIVYCLSAIAYRLSVIAYQLSLIGYGKKDLGHIMGSIGFAKRQSSLAHGLQAWPVSEQWTHNGKQTLSA